MNSASLTTSTVKFQNYDITSSQTIYHLSQLQSQFHRMQIPAQIITLSTISQKVRRLKYIITIVLIE